MFRRQGNCFFCFFMLTIQLQLHGIIAVFYFRFAVFYFRFAVFYFRLI